MSGEPTPGEYITQKLEPRIQKKWGIPDENGLFPSVYLETPLGRVVYKDAGTAEVEKDGLTFRLSYQSLDNTADASAIKAIKIFNPFSTLNIKAYRKLSDFFIRDKEGHTLTLTDLVPKDWSFSFYPDSAFSEFEGMTLPLEKTVAIQGDLTDPKTILSSLHEGGHAYSYVEKNSTTIETELRKYNAVKSRKNPPSLDDMAFFLREEREAWAYAIRKILPFCNGSNHIFTKDGVLTYAHHRLQYPSERISDAAKR